MSINTGYAFLLNKKSRKAVCHGAMLLQLTSLSPNEKHCYIYLGTDYKLKLTNKFAV